MLLVLRESAWIVLAGATGGISLALLCGRAADSLLYGLKPSDPIFIAGAGLVLGIAALAAALILAPRAARVEPMSALRHEWFTPLPRRGGRSGLHEDP